MKSRQWNVYVGPNSKVEYNSALTRFYKNSTDGLADVYKGISIPKSDSGCHYKGRRTGKALTRNCGQKRGQLTEEKSYVEPTLSSTSTLLTRHAQTIQSTPQNQHWKYDEDEGTRR